MIIKYQEDGQWFVTNTNHIDYYQDAVEIDMNDPLITVQVLTECWESDLEGANRHSMMDIPTNLVNVLRFVGCGEEKIKEALWEILVTQDGWLT